MTTPCECPLAGWCARHRRTKTEHLRSLCQKRADYRRLWDFLATGKKESVLKPAEKSEPEALAIINEVCRPCEHFEPSKLTSGGTCGVCSCRNNRKGLLTYIQQAGARCPKEKW